MDEDWQTHYRVSYLYSVVLAIQHDMKRGWFESIEALAHGDTFNDFLRQSKELLDLSFTQAAAVIAGCALETHLRQLCKKVGIDTLDANTKPMKAEIMRTQLLENSQIKKYEARRVATWLTIRNSAAHAETDQFDRSAVNTMIEEVGAFIERYPA
ncbi:MAG: hypothetical protein ACYDHP_08480 [Ferrimicrobium sp.]